MNTTAIGIVAAIFGGVAVILSQYNHLYLSVIFGALSVLLMLFSLFVHRGESKGNKTLPELKIELIPTPSFCSTFDSGIPNDKVNIHRTAIILYLKITNTGESPTQIGKIHVGYENMENIWHWLTDETTLLDDFTMPIGENTKIYPFLKQKNHLINNDLNTYLAPGQTINGIVYFEQKASGGNLYPKIDENFNVKIKIKVHDTKGRSWTIDETITKVMIGAAREHCPQFGMTLLLANGD